MKVSGNDRVKTIFDDDSSDYQRKSSKSEYSSTDYDRSGRKSIENRQSVSKKKKKKKKKSKTRKIIGLLLMIFLAILTVVFSVLLIKYPVFTWSVILLIIIALLAIFIVVFLTQRRKADGLQLFGMVLSVLMIIILSVGSFYFIRGGITLNAMTEEKYSFKTYNVAVRMDDAAETLEDTISYIYATIPTLDSNKYYLAATVELTNQLQCEVQMVKYGNLPEAYNALINKQAGVLFFENSYTSSLSEIDEKYEENIKIIATIELEEKVEDENTASVDVLNHPFIIFLSGGDDYEELSTTGRCDAVIMAAVNPNTHQILLISIQRDYYVQFPGVTGELRDKFTHSGVYGIDTSIATLNQLFGCEINYYFRLNFTSLIDIVDAVGGVTLYNEYEFDAPEDELHYAEGWITLNGFETLQYARERKTLSYGDYARATHQQLVISALVEKLSSPTTLALYYNNLMEALENCAITNMEQQEILALIRNQIANGPSWDIQKYVCDGYNVYQPSYAMGGMEVDVCIPYKECVDFASNMITRLTSGQLLTNIEDEEPTDFSLIVDPISEEEAAILYGDYDGDGDSVNEPAEAETDPVLDEGYADDYGEEVVEYDYEVEENYGEGENPEGDGDAGGEEGDAQENEGDAQENEGDQDG